jgi:hypothetical protein
MGQLRPGKWQERIKRSLKLQEIRKKEAAKFLRAYAGDYSDSGKNKRDGIEKDLATINFVYSYIETVGPTVFSGTPSVMVEEKSPEYEASAKKYQAAINYFLIECGAKKHFKRCRFDRFFGHTGILTDWEYDEIMEKMEEPYQKSIAGIPLVNPFNGAPVMGKRSIEVPRVNKDELIIKRINPWDIILDSDADTREEDRFRIIRQVVTYESFMEMNMISKKIRDRVQPKKKPSDLQRQPFDDSDSSASGDAEWVVLYKIFDWEHKECLLLTDKEEADYIYQKPWEWDIEYENDPFPLSILEAKIDVENPYTFSEFKAYWPQVEEKNRIRTTIQSHTRRQAPGWVAKKGSNDADQLDKFAQAKIGEVVEMNDPAAIGPRPQPELSSDTYNFNKIVEDDLDSTSGYNEVKATAMADTATEASINDKKSSVRKDNTAQEFEEFVACVGAKAGMLLQQYLDEPTAVKIANPQKPAEMLWVKVSKEEIQGEFHYSVKPGILQHKNEAVRRQQTLKFIELMAGNPHANQRYLAQKGCEVFDFDPNLALKSQAEMDKEASDNLPEKPPLTFDKIKIELLPPELQQMVIKAAVEQNGAAPKSVEAPAQQGGTDDIDSLMSELNMNENTEAPVNGEVLPPPTPVSAMSEGQGGQAGGIMV